MTAPRALARGGLGAHRASALAAPCRAAPHRARALAALCLAASIAAPSPCAADPTPADAAAAEALFNEGRRLIGEGEVAAACAKFAESYRLDPALGALLNLATCHERAGRTASAWSEYKDAATQALRAGDAARQRFAEEHAAALEPSLARLVVTAADRPEGLAVTRDGVALGEASLGAPLPVDPGTHWIAAEAPGRRPWRKRIDVAAGGREEIEIPALEVAPRADANDGRTAPGARGDGRRTAGLVLGGLGAASLVLGGVFVGLTAAETSSADERCPDKRCDAVGLEGIQTARTYAWIADIGIGVGALGLVAGGYLLLTAEPSSDPAPAAAWRLVPLVGSRGGGVGASLSF